MRFETLTGSANDLFNVAVNVAGFDAQSLLLTIYRLQGKRGARANSRTVEKAMGILAAEEKTEPERQQPGQIYTIWGWL